MPDEIDQAQEVIFWIKNSSLSIGQKLNDKKMKVMVYNYPRNEMILKINNGAELEVAEHFKYLGPWCNISQADISARKAMASIP